MQIFDSAFPEIIEPVSDARKIACEILRVKHHAHHLVGMVHVRMGRASGINTAKRRFALSEAFAQHIQKVLKGLLIIVQFHVEPFELIIVFLQSYVETAFFLSGFVTH